MAHPIRSILLGAAAAALAVGQPVSAQTTGPGPSGSESISQSPAPLAAADVSTSNIGDVIYSILPPELFEKTHIGRWALLDGAELASETGLYQFLVAQGRLDLLSKDDGPVKLFDARGVFLRGLNLARDANEGDADGSLRAVGSHQSDQIKEHVHNVSVSVPADEASKGGPGNHKVADGRANRSGNTVSCDACGSETRPKNIALYIYVKIGSSE